MKEPVRTKTYENTFCLVEGQSGRDVMKCVEAMLISLRKKAAADFAERLMNYGHFNGMLTSNVYYTETHVRCEVIADDYGLPLRVDEDEAEWLKAEISACADRADELAHIWGDEGNFRRLRDRLRELAGR